VRLSPSVDEPTARLLFDAQTSGGLLIAVSPDQADALLKKLRTNHPHAAVVGECVARRDVSIVVE
jgi:selenide,water dikinase